MPPHTNHQSRHEFPVVSQGTHPRPVPHPLVEGGARNHHKSRHHDRSHGTRATRSTILAVIKLAET